MYSHNLLLNSLSLSLLLSPLPSRCVNMKLLLLSVAVSWHPIHEKLFASGGSDGAILFWLVG